MLPHHVKEAKCVSASVGGYVDHVHLLVGLSRTVTIAKLVEQMKAETSKWAKKAIGGHSTFSWQAGYGAFSVSHSIRDSVEYLHQKSGTAPRKAFVSGRVSTYLPKA